MRKIEKRLRGRIKELEETLANVKEDREKHRMFWVTMLRESIGVHGQGKTFSMAWLIERIAKHFNSVQTWWWA